MGCVDVDARAFELECYRRLGCSRCLEAVEEGGAEVGSVDEDRGLTDEDGRGLADLKYPLANVKRELFTFDSPALDELPKVHPSLFDRSSASDAETQRIRAFGCLL